MAAGETISWGNIANGRVQPHSVVIGNEALDKSSGILMGERAAWPETIDLEALVPSLDFPLGSPATPLGLSNMSTDSAWRKQH